MQEIKRIAGLIILSAVIVGGVYIFLQKREAVKDIKFRKSDAKGLKG
jgi:hypothetical protein